VEDVRLDDAHNGVPERIEELENIISISAGDGYSLFLD
jgi:hypothetical protein